MKNMTPLTWVMTIISCLVGSIIGSTGFNPVEGIVYCAAAGLIIGLTNFWLHSLLKGKKNEDS